MKITNELFEQINQNSISTEKLYTQTTKSLMELVAGDRFTARVLDIKPGNIQLQMADGTSLTAKSLVAPDVRIGDKAMFLVKENTGGGKGQILIEMVKPETGGATPGIVKEALSAARMQFTPQNADIVNMLIKASMPIDPQTVQRTAFFKYTAPDLTDKEILFLVKENFPATEKSVDIYRGFADNTLKLNDNISGLLKELEALTREPSANVPKAIADLKEKIPMLRNKLFIDLKNDGLKGVSGHFREIEETVEELRAALKNIGNTGEAMKQLDNVKDNLRLMESVKEQKQFMQIPFVVEGSENQAELHVLNRKRGRAGRADDDNATAVLSLDYDNLGHVEVVINKMSKIVTLQFKSDTPKSITLLQDNAHNLISRLEDKGYGVVIGFKKADEKFDLVDGIEPERSSIDQKRYSFDMRV